jgi:hypothetical protein
MALAQSRHHANCIICIEPNPVAYDCDFIILLNRHAERLIVSRGCSLG